MREWCFEGVMLLCYFVALRIGPKISSASLSATGLCMAQSSFARASQSSVNVIIRDLQVALMHWLVTSFCVQISK